LAYKNGPGTLFWPDLRPYRLKRQKCGVLVYLEEGRISEGWSSCFSRFPVNVYFIYANNTLRRWFSFRAHVKMNVAIIILNDQRVTKYVYSFVCPYGCPQCLTYSYKIRCRITNHRVRIRRDRPLPSPPTRTVPRRAIICYFSTHTSIVWQFGTRTYEKRSERRKHCALVVRRRQKISSRRRPLPGGEGRPKFNQLEMVTTFTYRPSLVKIDARNFWLSW